MRLSPVVAEWIKKGLDYRTTCRYFPSFITPVVIPAGAEGDPLFKLNTEGLLTCGAIIADSPYIGIRLKSGHPFIDTERTLTTYALYLLGLLAPNNYMWASRYGTVILFGGVPYTVYAMQILEEFHWYKDFAVTPFNIDAVPHNIYLYQYSYSEPVEKTIRLPI